MVAAARSAAAALLLAKPMTWPSVSWIPGPGLRPAEEVRDMGSLVVVVVVEVLGGAWRGEGDG